MKLPNPAELTEDTLGFFKGLRPRVVGKPRRGETIASLMVGGMSLVLGGISLVALLGYSPASIPDLTRRATIVLGDSSLGFGPAATVAGWWYVPDFGYWTLVASGLFLAILGIRPTRRGGRPMTSVIGIALNGAASLIGYLLAFTDHRVW